MPGPNALETTNFLCVTVLAMEEHSFTIYTRQLIPWKEQTIYTWQHVPWASYALEDSNKNCIC